MTIVFKLFSHTHVVQLFRILHICVVQCNTSSLMCSSTVHFNALQKLFRNNYIPFAVPLRQGGLGIFPKICLKKYAFNNHKALARLNT